MADDALKMVCNNFCFSVKVRQAALLEVVHMSHTCTASGHAVDHAISVLAKHYELCKMDYVSASWCWRYAELLSWLCADQALGCRQT